jgi:hypothetical protein
MQVNRLFVKSSLAVAGAAAIVCLSAPESQAATFVGRYSFTNGSRRATVTGRPVVFGQFAAAGVSGTPIEASIFSGRFRGSNWTRNATPNLGQYFEFSANPLGNLTTYNRFGFNSRSFSGFFGTGLGPRNWLLQAKVGSGSFFNVLSGALGPVNAVNQGFSNASLTNVTQQVVFRLYGFNAPVSANTWIVDDVFVSGISAIPTPAALPAILGFGAQLWRKRKQQEAEV